MSRTQNRRTAFSAAVLAGLLLIGAASRLRAQAGQSSQVSAPPASARAAAPVDFTGIWVSLITEDWRFRMAVPEKGDYGSVPLNAEGRRVADAWDPARDLAEEVECKAYGAPGIMRMPVRLRITWENDDTLRIDTDTGQQTRLLRFGQPQPAAAEPSWQGVSVAAWEFAGGGGRDEKVGDHLKLVTTNMRSGYLQRNGLPYSERAVLTEYFDLHHDVGVDWITHTRIIEDPEYVTSPYIVTSHFRRESDDSQWNPTPCQVQ